MGVPRAPRQRKPKGPDEKTVHVTVPQILTPNPAAFPAKLRLAIQRYLDTEPRSWSIAAKQADMSFNELIQFLKQDAIREYIQKQEEMIDEKVAELRARARVLTQDHLDAATVDMLESVTAPANAKVKMIEVGYKRFGLLREKVEATGAGGGPLVFELVRIGTRKTNEE
jgi:hypothetical protein